LAAAFDVSEVIASEMGPVVGTHAGPGTVGAAFFQPETAEEAELISPLSA
jgi:fatty acid-binding protein DegV